MLSITVRDQNRPIFHRVCRPGSSPRDVEARADALFKRAREPRDAATFFAEFTSRLWADLHRPLLDVEAQSGPAPELVADLTSVGGLTGLERRVATADKSAARQALNVLARSREAWSDPRFHAIAARALLIVERPPEAGLEWELHQALSPGGVTAAGTLGEDLAGLARQASARARSTEQLGNIRGAVSSMEDALRTAPACLATSELVWRENLGSLLDLEVADARKLLERRRTMLEFVISGTRETQLQYWLTTRRLVRIAHAYRGLGRIRDALQTLGLVDQRFSDPYLAFTVQVLARAWNDR